MSKWLYFTFKKKYTRGGKFLNFSHSVFADVISHHHIKYRNYRKFAPFPPKNSVKSTHLTLNYLHCMLFSRNIFEMKAIFSWNRNSPRQVGLTYYFEYCNACGSPLWRNNGDSSILDDINHIIRIGSDAR